MRFDTLFFDLDDTLYPANTGLWNAIRDRMGFYMHERLQIPWENIPRLRIHYLETYGTTLRGLQNFFTVDTEEYLAYVHDLPLDQYLHSDPDVRALLLSLPQQKWIFTNADEAHARRVLAVLDLSDCFQGVIDLHALDFVCKPERETYLRALKIASAADPSRCIILDDAMRNLIPAHELGFTTILVQNERNAEHAGQDQGIDYTITHPRDLRQALPELWEMDAHHDE
jgi:putative hydrolase of the HAD superfamily